MIPNSPPVLRPGVSKPPAAPARRAPMMTSNLSNKSVAASARPMSFSNPACAKPFPLPSSCGNRIASRPMLGNTTAHQIARRQFLGACARAASHKRSSRITSKIRSIWSFKSTAVQEQDLFRRFFRFVHRVRWLHAPLPTALRATPRKGKNASIPRRDRKQSHWCHP